MKFDYLWRTNAFSPVVGFAKNTDSYKWVIQILWLQIGVLKNGS